MDIARKSLCKFATQSIAQAFVSSLLDAELTARYLLNEGEFSHENTLYVDEEYKRDNQEQWLKVFKRGSVHLISFAKRSSWLNARFSKVSLLQ